MFLVRDLNINKRHNDKKYFISLVFSLQTFSSHRKKKRSFLPVWKNLCFFSTQTQQRLQQNSYRTEYGKKRSTVDKIVRYHKKSRNIWFVEKQHGRANKLTQISVRFVRIFGNKDSRILAEGELKSVFRECFEYNNQKYSEQNQLPLPPIA